MRSDSRNSSVMNRSGLRWGVALGVLLAWAFWSQRQTNALHRELAELRRAVDSLAVAASGSGLAPAEAPEDDRLRAELLSLRAELAAVIRRLPDRPGMPVSSGTVVTSPTIPVSLPPSVRHAFVEAAGLPGPVADALRQQLGGAPFEGAQVKQSDGRSFYSVDTVLPDGRGIELVVDGTGQVLTRSLETRIESLPPSMQEQIAAEVGDTPVRRIAEVFEDGRTIYRVHAKGQERAVQLMFSPEGDLIQAEVTRREAKP